MRTNELLPGKVGVSAFWVMTSFLVLFLDTTDRQALSLQ